MLFTDIILATPVLYVILQAVALRRMDDGWRAAALFPGLLMGAALLVFVVGIVTNASMAAMWLVLGLPVATLYLALLLPLHWIARLRR